MRIFIAILTGLGETPAGADDGMRALAASLPLPAGATVQTVAHGWDEREADHVCRALKDEIVAFAPHKVIVLSHSFGGGLAVFFTQWLWDWYSGQERTSPPFLIDLLVLFDPCPNGLQFGGGECVDPFACYSDNERRWFVPETTVANALAFFQRAGRPLGVKGIPLFERAGITNADVTNWTDPTLGHVDGLGFTGIINDVRVQDLVRAAVTTMLGGANV